MTTTGIRTRRCGEAGREAVNRTGTRARGDGSHNSGGRVASRLVALALALVGTGCVVDKQLGEPGDDAAGDGGEGSLDSDTGSVSDDGATSIGATGTDPTGGAASTDGNDADDLDDAGDETQGPNDSTGDPPQICADWAAPPFDCEANGGATATLISPTGLAPVLTEAMCLVASLESVNETTDELQVDCARGVLIVEITTEAPHQTLPLMTGQPVVVSTEVSIEEGFSDTQIGSFTLHSTDGALLVAWINSVGIEPPFSTALDIEPVQFGVSLSGCPGTSQPAFCDVAGQIIGQRGLVELGDPESPQVVFDGSSVGLDAGPEAFTVTVDAALRMVCKDPDCATSNEGPLDHLRILVLADG